MITYSTQRHIDDQNMESMIVKPGCRQSMSDKLTAMKGYEPRGMEG